MLIDESRKGAHVPPRPLPAPAPPQSFGVGDGGADQPHHPDQAVAPVDKMTDDVGEIKVSIGSIRERLRHIPLRTEMYLAGGATLALLLGFMSKGFGWL